MTHFLHFQPVKIEDINWIYEALQQTALENKVSDRFTLTPEKLEEMLFKKPFLAEALMAYVDQQVVGFILFSITNRNFNLFPTPGFYIHNFYVAPEFRRQKIGTQLLNNLKIKAQDLGYCRIDWVVLNNNVEGDKFFKSYEGTKKVDYISYQRIYL
ncbi:MAG: GNAT family N-acetyltransferase [Janthinobacterium lividum]